MPKLARLLDAQTIDRSAARLREARHSAGLVLPFDLPMHPGTDDRIESLVIEARDKLEMAIALLDSLKEAQAYAGQS